MGRTKTREEYIFDFNNVHGVGRYDYSKFYTKNAKEKGIIICHKIDADGKEHGEFPMSATTHKLGHGCPKCGRERTIMLTANKLRKSKEEHISDFNDVHGEGRYDYSKFDVINNSEKGTIICHRKDENGDEHGEFHMSAHNHAAGHGCPKCANESRRNFFRISLCEFITKANKKHGEGRYDYSLVEINGDNKSKVNIKCNKCGKVFEQRINDHLNGHGCHCCRMSKLEEKTMLMLKNCGIKYETEKRFYWLMSAKNWEMPLDFYLTDYNVAIECQGVQHYEHRENSIFTKEAVEEIKQRDILKYNLCQEHKIHIYYVKYNDNVEERLLKIIEELNSDNQTKPYL